MSKEGGGGHHTYASRGYLAGRGAKDSSCDEEVAAINKHQRLGEVPGPADYLRAVSNSPVDPHHHRTKKLSLKLPQKSSTRPLISIDPYPGGYSIRP